MCLALGLSACYLVCHDVHHQLKCVFVCFYQAESRHRGSERAWRAERKPSPTDIWEETTSAHSEECCPHYKAHSSGRTGTVCQWHTCFLRPILPGVLTAGRVVSLYTDFVFFFNFFLLYLLLPSFYDLFSYTFVSSAHKHGGFFFVYKACAYNTSNWIKHTVHSLNYSAAGAEMFHPPGLARWCYIDAVVGTQSVLLAHPAGWWKEKKTVSHWWF